MERVMATMNAHTIVSGCSAPGRVSHPRAVAPHAPTANRRALLGMLGVAPLALSIPRPALALIPDDDDEELVAKAKASRAERLARDKRQIGQFVATADPVAAPAQSAINALAEVGEQLEAGRLEGLGDLLGDSLLSGVDGATSVTDSLDRLRSTAASGSLRETKMRYIEAVEKLESWARDSGSVKTLKGF
ncbi:TEF14 [Auxenochlorella protothecoides x Auxenochlorella symbiontica]